MIWPGDQSQEGLDNLWKALIGLGIFSLILILFAVSQNRSDIAGAIVFLYISGFLIISIFRLLVMQNQGPLP